MPDRKGRPGILTPKHGDTASQRITSNGDTDGLFDQLLENDGEGDA